MNRPTLSFDGCGINGPDEYRTRLFTVATPELRNSPGVQRYGRMFASAPTMLQALRKAETALAYYEQRENERLQGVGCTPKPPSMTLQAVRDAIAEAECPV